MSTKLDWSDARRRLLALMREVGAEISAYPRPITACDAQFNHLLELRRMLPGELARLQVAAADPSASVEAFIRDSPCRDALCAVEPATGD
jgi:hypothetical protein